MTRRVQCRPAHRGPLWCHPLPPPLCHRYRLLLSNTTLLEVEPSRLPLPDSPSGDKEVSHVGIGPW